MGQISIKEFNKNLSVDNYYNNHFMIEAMKMAKLAFDNDEVPVGAIVVKNGEIIGRGFNQVITKHSVSSHAEINAINQASQYIQNYRLKDCDHLRNSRALSYVCKSNNRCQNKNLCILARMNQRQEPLNQLINFYIEIILITKCFLVEDTSMRNPLICLGNFFNPKENREFLKKLYFNSSQIGQ